MKFICSLFFTAFLAISINAQVQQEIANLLEGYAQYERLSGTVLVQKADKIVYENTFGCANYEQEVDNTLETIFNIGSLSKQFTAAAILHLVVDGEINLDETINQYLGIYASEKWEKVTVHHLLTHTSGIPSLMQFGQGLDDVFPEETAIPLAKLIGHFKHLKLLNKPGKKYQYNNSGYVLLAAIVEVVSGQTYGNFLQANIFGKYGLHHTSHGIKQKENLALPYYGYQKDLLKRAPIYHSSWLMGAGSIFSTIKDLAVWNQVIHSETFLTPSLRKLFFQKHEDAGNGRYYAYGWEIQERADKNFIHHDGTIFGYTCDFLYEPEAKILSIILTNKTHESLQLIGKSENFIRQTNRKLQSLFFGKKYNPLPKIRPINNNEQVAGTYNLSADYQIALFKNEGIWRVQPTTTSKEQFSPLAIGFQNNIPLTSEQLQKANRAVQALVKKQFWKFGKEAQTDMKILAYLGIIRLVFNGTLKGMGSMEKGVIFGKKGHSVDFRIFCEKGVIDFFLSFNDEGQIQGVFDSNRYFYADKQLPKLVRVFPTENGFFLDGFSFGEPDGEFVILANGQMNFRFINEN